MNNPTNAIIIVLLVIILLLALKGGVKRLKGGCCAGGNAVKKVKPKNVAKKDCKYRYNVYIDGMTCKNCAARVENEFNRLTGCIAKVKLSEKCAVVLSREEISEAQLRQTAEKNGHTFVRFTSENL